MSGFGQSALVLSGLAARVLGWRPQEFWDATPAELSAALGLEEGAAATPGFDRSTLERMMEQDHE